MLAPRAKCSHNAQTYALLEGRDLLIGEGVCLGNDWDQVDLGVQSAHHLNVERLEGVSGGLNEVYAGVHAVVHNVHAVDLVLSVEVRVEALLNVLNDWSPRIIIVDEISKPGCIHHGEAKADTVLLNVGRNGLYADSLWCEVERWLLALLWGIQRRIEQGVHERRFSKTGFTCKQVPVNAPSWIVQRVLLLTNDHNVEVEAFPHTLAMPLVRKVRESNVACELPAHDVPHISGCLCGRFGILR